MCFCLFCCKLLAASGQTVSIPGQAPLRRFARRNRWHRRSSHRKRLISTCWPSLASHVPDPGRMLFMWYFCGSHVLWCRSISVFLPWCFVPPCFSAITLQRTAGPGFRTASALARSPGCRCLPMAFDHLTLRLAPVALREGNSMLDGRPREPEFPRNGRGPEAGLPGGQDQPFLDLCNGAGLVRFSGLP